MARSKEFEEQKELIQLKLSAEQTKHKLKMQELEFSRENNRIFHERELERGRIKWAEVKKNQQRKAEERFAGGYH